MSKSFSILSYLKRIRITSKPPLSSIYPVLNYSKEVTPRTTDDYLLLNLKNVTSPYTILELVSKHHNIMNQKHVLQALRTLFSLQKSGKSDLRKEEILGNPHFERLCRSLRSQARKIEVNDAVDALKVLSYLGVPSDSIVIQTILQMLRHYINDFSLQQIIFLDYVLHQMKPSPLSNALFIALPIVFEAQAKFKLDPDNVFQVINCLQYVSKKPVTDKCIELIINTLMDCFDNNFAINSQQAKSILWSVCDMRPDFVFEPVITKAIPFFIQDISNMSYEDIETTLHKLISRYSSQFPFYYSEELCDAFVSRIIDGNVGFDEAVYCLNKLNKVDHVNDRLLDYISEKCVENPDLILNTNDRKILILCTGLAKTEYRPTHWEVLKDLFYRKDFKNLTHNKIPLINLCVHLCILEIFKSEVFETALKMEHLQSLLIKNIQYDIENFLLVLQTISVFKKDVSDFLPSRSFIDQVVKKLKPPQDFPLEGSLKSGLGGDSYVATDIRTNLGHFIDHVVVMRKGGYPVAFTRKDKMLEDLDMLPESQVVLILALRPWHYMHNCKRMKGSTSLMIKTLEAGGYSVVPVCLSTWTSLPDFEKIPYLMRAIKLKLDDFKTLSTVGY